MANYNSNNSDWPKDTLVREWILFNLAADIDINDIVATCVERGEAESAVRAFIDHSVNQEWLLVAKELSYRADKLASLMWLLGDLRSRIEPYSSIEYVDGPPTLDEFEKCYLLRNRPVVIQRALEGWGALNRWSPDFFKNHYGDMLVHVSVNRDKSHYDYTLRDELKQMNLKDFIAMIETRADNAAYIVAASRFLLRPEAASLSDDIGAIGDLLDTSAPDKPHASFWFGSAGTITTLHHDDRSSLLCQVYGEKEILLFPPYCYDGIYNEKFCWSPVDPWHPDYSKYPRSRSLQPLRVQLKPNEALLIPVGWWHAVKSLSVSISMTVHNFRRDTRWRQAYYADNHRWQEAWRRTSVLPFPDRPPLG